MLLLGLLVCMSTTSSIVSHTFVYQIFNHYTIDSFHMLPLHLRNNLLYSSILLDGVIHLKLVEAHNKCIIIRSAHATIANLSWHINAIILVYNSNNMKYEYKFKISLPIWSASIEERNNLFLAYPQLYEDYKFSPTEFDYNKL